MFISLSWHLVRCILILLVVFEYSLQVSANVTNNTYLGSGNCSYGLPSSLMIHCNESEERVSGFDFDFNFDEMQDDLMGLLSYSEDVDGISERQGNSSDVETRIKDKGIMNIGGRNKILNIFRLTKGLYKKNMGTLLLAYKLKFFTLFPLLVAAMMVIVKASGLAGFFFALFIGSVAVKSISH